MSENEIRKWFEGRPCVDDDDDIKKILFMTEKYGKETVDVARKFMNFLSDENTTGKVYVELYKEVLKCIYDKNTIGILLFPYPYFGTPYQLDRVSNEYENQNGELFKDIRSMNTQEKCKVLLNIIREYYGDDAFDGNRYYYDFTSQTIIEFVPKRKFTIKDAITLEDLGQTEWDSW